MTTRAALLRTTALLLLWVLAYACAQPFSLWTTTALLGPEPWGRLGNALAFLVYEVPKVGLLLLLVAAMVGLLRSFVQPSAVRAWIAGKPAWVAHFAAAGAGMMTPFCSCSAVPLFMGLVQGGVPLGPSLTFLVASPAINEMALGLLLALFGWKVAALYLAAGLTVAVLGGAVLGRLGLEDQVQALTAPLDESPVTWTWAERLAFAEGSSLAVFKKVWPWLLGGVGLGSFLHAWVPQDALAPYLSGQSWWNVPVAVLAGVPLYANAAGVVPLLHALLEKGVPLGTALAFLMAVIGLSLPEAMLLKQVLKPRLLGAYFGVVALGIMGVGWALNWALH